MEKKKKQVVLNKDNFRTVWFNGEPGEIDVDVYKDNTLILQWTYPKLAGNSINGNAAIFLDQVILEARAKAK